MKNKIKTIILIFIVFILSTNIVFAGLVDEELKDVTISTTTVPEINNAGNKIVGILQVVGIMSSVIVLMIIGIKYMCGSIEQKAEYKKTFPIYLVGCLLVFAASALFKILYDFIDSVM